MRERRRGRRRELLYRSVDEPAADERCVFIREQTKASSSSHGFLTSPLLFLVLLSDWRLSILCPKRIMFPENENRPGFFFSAPLPPPAPRCSVSFFDKTIFLGGRVGFWVFRHSLDVSHIWTWKGSAVNHILLAGVDTRSLYAEEELLISLVFVILRVFFPADLSSGSFSSSCCFSINICNLVHWFWWNCPNCRWFKEFPD